MDIGSLLLGLALLLGIAFIVARPLLEQSAPPEAPARPADDLVSHREQVLTQLRDLDFDHAMGKINQEDYTAQRAQLVAEGVAILKQLDALGVGQPASAQPAAGLAPDDAIEAAVAQLRARRAAADRPAPAQRDLDAEIEAGVAARRRAAGNKPPAGRRDPEAEIEASVAARRAANAARPAPVKPSADKPNGAETAAAARLVTPPAGQPGPASEPTIIGQPAAAARPTGAEALACAQCGAEVLPDDRFCPKCGSALTVACGNCGRTARAGDQFCASCGQSLPGAVVGLRPARAQS